jgi:hypothetical protein
MKHLRIKPEESVAVIIIADLLKSLGSSETEAQIMHQALHDGLLARKKKLSAIVGRLQ